MSIRKYDTNEYYFHTWSNNQAYILGFIVSDGYIQDERGCLSFGINPKDREILEFIRSEISPNIPIRECVIYDSKYDVFRDKLRLDIHSVIITRYLNSIGIIQSKTGKEIIPIQLPNEFFGDFLRGVFDGDGCVETRKTNPLRCSICSASKQFLINLKSCCNNIGNIYSNNSNDIYNWYMSTYDALTFKNIIYKNDGFCLSRKRSIFDSFDISMYKKDWWNETEVELLRQEYLNSDYKTISNKIGRSVDSIEQKLRQYGLFKRNIKTWEKDEIEILKKMVNSKINFQVIANTLNRTKKSIVRKIHHLGIHNQRNRWTTEEDSYIINNINQGIDWLTKRLNRSKSSVLTRVWRLGLTSNSLLLKGI